MNLSHSRLPAKNVRNSHLKCFQHKSETKNRRIDKIYIHFRCAGLNGICGVCWMMVVVAATVVRLVQMPSKCFSKTFATMHSNSKRIGSCACRVDVNTMACTTCTGKSKFSVRWIREVCIHARCCVCRKDTLVSLSFTGITSYLPLKVKDKLLTLSVSVKTFIYLFEPKTCRRSRSPSHIRSRCRLVALHTHIRFCPISIFIPFDVICYSIHLHAKSV